MPVRHRGIAGGIAQAASNINDMLQRSWSEQEMAKRQQELAALQHMQGLERLRVEQPNPDILNKIGAAKDETSLPSETLVRQSMTNAARQPGSVVPPEQPNQATWGLDTSTDPNGGMNLETGESVPLITAKQTTPLTQMTDAVLGARDAQKGQITAQQDREHAEHPVTQKFINGDNTEQERTLPQADPRQFGERQVGRTPQQEEDFNAASARGQKVGNMPTDQTIAADVKREGALAAAKYPWDEKLANLHEANQEELRQWTLDHPGMTTAQKNQHVDATHGLEMDAKLEPMLSEMERQGMLGALKGRVYATDTGDIKSEVPFKDPEQARLAADFFSTMDTYAKLFRKVHSGMAAGRSPVLEAQFKRIISGIGDPSIIRGQMDSVRDTLKIYRDDPNAPPGLTLGESWNDKQKAAAGQSSGPQPLQTPFEGIDPSLMQFLH